MDRWCLITVLSALYGKLLLVIGVGFVTAELVTARIPLYFYEGYFTFLYSASLIFVAVASSCLIRNGDGFDFSLGRGRTAENKDGGERSEVHAENNGMGSHRRRRRASFIMETGTGFGSLFFRLGILGFGLATMVYCGLEFGSFFEIMPNSSCYRILRGINPILQMAFTFAQMYFVFMASRPSVSKFQSWTKFGLMHLVATNLGVWIKTLVHESIQGFSFRYEEAPSVADDVMLDAVFPARAEDEPPPIFNATCRSPLDIMGSVVATSAPYLCPFLVQFSFVCAAIFYTMWRCADTPWSVVDADSGHRLRALQPRRVDCVGASKGLFLGLFVLATNVICLILFFVLVNHPRFHRLAVYLAHVSHVAVMLVSLAAISVGLLRARPLADGGAEADRPLSRLLLHLATFGSFLYSVFGVLAGAMTAGQWHEPSLLLAASSALAVVQVTVQSLFLLHTSGRWEARRAALDTPRGASHSVTLLLISNVTLWGVATFEIQHAQVNPIQAQFYGHAIWSVVQAVTLPLVIFYRFQSAVMLASLWKITCLSPTK